MTLLADTPATLVPGLLDHVLRDVERPLLMERSVKSIGQEWRAGRFLISFPRTALAPAGRKHFARIANGLGVPRDAFHVLAPEYDRALSVHLGYEPEPDGAILKLYLEFPRAQAPEPGLVFRALKWRGDTWVQSRYWHCAPADMQAEISEVLPDGPVREVLADLAARTELSPRLMRVDEPSSPRRSVDLNLANSQRTLADLNGVLGSAFLGQPALDYLAQHARDGVGHLAAGTARDGQTFVTLYHGVRFVTGAVQ